MFKLNIIRILLVLLISGNLSGCSSRFYFQKNDLTPVFNLYNRNFIVAAPTAIGNYLCGTPFFLLVGGIDAVVTGHRSEAYYDFINGVYLVPATTCGAITGTAFIPFSFMYKEDPWYTKF